MYKSIQRIHLYLTLSVRGGGGVHKVPALIATIENFLDIHGSSDFFPPKFIGGYGFGKKIASSVSLVAMATQFSTQYLVKTCS